MSNDRPDEQIQLNTGADNDASVRLLAEVMPDLRRGVTTNDSPVKQVERVVQEVELSVIKASGGQIPAGERDILIQWGEDSIRDALKDLKLKLEPTPEDRQKAGTDAKEHLEKNDLYNLLSKADQQALTKMQEAILNGDTKALAELVKQFKSDPEKLEALGHVIEKDLKEMGAHVQIDITASGKLMIYDKYARHAVEVSADGKVAVRAIQANLDGSVDVLEGREVLRPKADEAIKAIADSAVLDVTRPTHSTDWFPPIGFPPIVPGEPGSNPSGQVPPSGFPRFVPGEPGIPRVPIYKPYQI